MQEAQGADVLPAQDNRYIRWQIYIALLAVTLGMLFGLFQALERARINPYAQLPVVNNYYQGLTLHGVLNVLVFTFAFTNAFLTLVVVRSLNRRIFSPFLLAASFWLTLVGVVLAGWAMLSGQANVLFTFYPPLKAHPLYYLGLTLVAASTWVTSANLFLSLRAWKRANPGQRAPLPAFVAVATYVMWDIASVGLAVEIVVLILPWSFGLIQTTDPLLARMLFWFTGHPIVYFWLLPAYISWYTMIPRQVGGKLLSDPLTRLVFLLFIVLSIPIGFHHQYTDPGISEGWKFVHGLLTLAVSMPSIITAFSVIAALENGGRARGGRGLFGWIPRLPWGDPSVSTQLLAMITFVFGGSTGILNASYNMNLVLHNTAWVPGHFHLTVGSAVTMSYMGILYWLLPHLTGRRLWAPKLGVLQGWLWLVGVFTMSRGMMQAGLENMPRRTAMAESAYFDLRPEWVAPGLLTAAGGTVLFISGMLFILIMVMTALASRRAEVVPEMPIAEAMQGAGTGWPALERWRLWVGASALLIILAYGPTLIIYAPALNAFGFNPALPVPIR
jgi:cytochrome c oxidase subunit 1